MWIFSLLFTRFSQFLQMANFLMFSLLPLFSTHRFLLLRSLPSLSTLLPLLPSLLPPYFPPFDFLPFSPSSLLSTFLLLPIYLPLPFLSLHSVLFSFSFFSFTVSLFSLGNLPPPFISLSVLSFSFIFPLQPFSRASSLLLLLLSYLPSLSLLNPSFPSPAIHILPLCFSLGNLLLLYLTLPFSPFFFLHLLPFQPFSLVTSLLLLSLSVFLPFLLLCFSFFLFTFLPSFPSPALSPATFLPLLSLYLPSLPPSPAFSLAAFLPVSLCNLF
jgi:hypothetical protein